MDKMEQGIDAASVRLQGLQSRAKAIHDADRLSMEAKLRALQDRIAKAKGEAKSAFQLRTEKLRKARKRTKEQRGGKLSAER